MSQPTQTFLYGYFMIVGLLMVKLFLESTQPTLESRDFRYIQRPEPNILRIMVRSCGVGALRGLSHNKVHDHCSYSHSIGKFNEIVFLSFSQKPNDYLWYDLRFLSKQGGENRMRKPMNSQGIVFLQAKQRDAFAEMLKIPLQTSLDFKSSTVNSTINYTIYSMLTPRQALYKQVCM